MRRSGDLDEAATLSAQFREWLVDRLSQSGQSISGNGQRLPGLGPELHLHHLEIQRLAFATAARKPDLAYWYFPPEASARKPLRVLGPHQFSARSRKGVVGEEDAELTAGDEVDE